MPINVLFVEDEADLRSVVVEALSQQGFSVTPAANGVEAITLLRGATQYAIVVTDVNMPEGVSGLDVAQEAAATQPSASVLVVSGLQRAQLPPHPCSRSVPSKALSLQTADHCDPRPSGLAGTAHPAPTEALATLSASVPSLLTQPRIWTPGFS